MGILPYGLILLWSLGGFLLTEHSCDHPLEPGYMPCYKLLGGFLPIEHSYDYAIDSAYTPCYKSLGGFLPKLKHYQRELVVLCSSNIGILP